MYLKKDAILFKLGFGVHEDHNEKRFLINSFKQSDRQPHSTNIEDLKINEDSSVVGQWSGPID